MKIFPREHRRLHWLSLAAIAALIFVAPPTAWADGLGDAKAAGWVGEQANGMLGIVDSSAPASTQALVESVNAKRREGYASIAKKNETSATAIAARAGERNIAKTQAGHYVKRSGEGWQKK
ncbi:MAG: YdbL family protein [Deltaproteobacteria bacterium]|nr:YdbL family protein [Deltaproteobacteria bacterium]MBW2666460.1 YdbL family protein [Deltaproteobacteria bacterium]